MKFTKSLAMYLGAIGLVCSLTLSIDAKAQTRELVKWNEGVSKSFKVEECVTIPGIPGVPKKCSPDIKYPCPKWNNPKKMCKTKGVCTPAVPGTPSTKQCGGVNFGTFGVRAQGDVDLVIKPNTSTTSIEASNTILITMFGGTMSATIACNVTATGNSQVCFDAITRQIKASNGSGAECKLAGVPQSNINMQVGIEMSVCTDLSINLSNPKKPTGKIGASVSAGVSFPSVTIAGKKISFPAQKWNQQIFSMPIK